MSTNASPLTTHVLDTSRGLPVSGLQVSLYKLIDGRWTMLSEWYLFIYFPMDTLYN